MQGIVVNGCVRDSAVIAGMPIGVKALNTHPLKSSKRDPGLRDIPVTFAGGTISPWGTGYMQTTTEFLFLKPN